MSQILKHLFLGSYREAKSLQLLQKKGIKAILITANHLSPYYPYQFTYKSLPLCDVCKEPIFQHFAEAIRFIHNETTQNRSVFVHCFRGKSRSSTIVISYLMWKYPELGFKKALDYCKNIRPIVKPNQGFKVQLMIFEDILERYRSQLVKLKQLKKSKLVPKLQELNSQEETKMDGTTPDQNHKIPNDKFKSSFDLLDHVITTYKPNYDLLKQRFPEEMTPKRFKEYLKLQEYAKEKREWDNHDHPVVFKRGFKKVYNFTAKLWYHGFSWMGDKVTQQDPGIQFLDEKEEKDLKNSNSSDDQPLWSSEIQEKLNQDPENQDLSQKKVKEIQPK